MKYGKGCHKRTPGAGRKPVQPQIEHAFVDIRVCLKGRVSEMLLMAKCKELHENLIATKADITEKEKLPLKNI